ncbi:MAG: thiol:disulfide interchange protein DsbA/DsbL [Lysobacteraceae bacterium]
MKRFALLLTVLLPLAACQQQAPAPAADTADTAGATAAPAPAGDGTPSEAAIAAAAASRNDAGSAAGEAAGASADATAAAPAATPAAAAADHLVAGTDYVEIQGGQPYQPLNGKIEVVEVFNFICPACNTFEPAFEAWKAKLPADVRVTYVPAAFGPQWLPYAQAYLVAESMGLDAKSHVAMFNAIHATHALPGEGQPPNEAAIAHFYATYGADPKQFVDAMHSFATDARLNRAKQFMLATGVQGTPTLVINGKYRVLGKSFDDMLRISDALVARERAAAGK